MISRICSGSTSKLQQGLINYCHSHGAVTVVYRVHASIVTVLINAFPGNSSVNMVQHATIEEAVFSVDLTDAPIDWLDSDHVICVTCDACPFRTYISNLRVMEGSKQLQVISSNSSRSTQTSKQ
jgi:hypothetical protein